MSNCASFTGRRRIVSPLSLVKRIASTREGNSCGANVRPIKRPQARGLELRGRAQTVIRIPHGDYDGEDEGVPLSGEEVVAVPEGFEVTE